MTIAFVRRSPRSAAPRRRRHQAHGYASPRRQRGERETEHRPGVPPVRRQEIDHADDQQMMRPPWPQHRELRLDVPEIGGKEQEPQQEDVVEGHVGRLDGSPRKRRRLARHPDETGRRGEAERTGDGQRSDLLLVLHHEDPDPRRQQEDSGVEEDPDLEPDGDEVPTGDAVEEGGLRAGEDVVRSQPGDRSDDVRVQITAPPSLHDAGPKRDRIYRASAAGRESTNAARRRRGIRRGVRPPPARPHGAGRVLAWPSER